jgi:hypothetical protein
LFFQSSKNNEIIFPSKFNVKQKNATPFDPIFDGQIFKKRYIFNNIFSKNIYFFKKGGDFFRGGQPPYLWPYVPNATLPNATLPNATLPNATLANATPPNATLPNQTLERSFKK